MTQPTSLAPDWFDPLVVDCRNLIEAAKLNAGLVLIEAKYELGKRILLDYKRFGSYTGGKTQKDLADELGTTQNMISRCISFAEKVNNEYDSFEDFIHSVDNLSWRKIALEWLPNHARGSGEPKTTWGIIEAECLQIIQACDEKIRILAEVASSVWPGWSSDWRLQE